MDKLNIKYRTAGKWLSPLLIRVEIPGWGGSPAQRKENGSEPQPWHCGPFVEAATYGVELIYQYETECHIINEDGQIRIDWDYVREPGGVLGWDEFAVSAPKPSHFYVFGTSVDLQAPPGHVLRTEPHPRFFTDTTGTVPTAACGHVKSEWWSKKLFVTFKAPAPGQRHIFRKGEPYVQILFVPQRTIYETTRMSAEEEAQRMEVENGILLAKSYIAKNVWHNSEGVEFNDHYKVLARAFEREGRAGVLAVVREAVERWQLAAPRDKTTGEYLKLAYQYQCEGKYVEAKQILFHARSIDPNNAEVANRIGVLAWVLGLRELALNAMGAAVALQPRSPAYHGNLGDMLRQMGRYEEADVSFRLSLQFNPHDPLVMSNLGLALAAQGRATEGLEACRVALTLDSKLPIVHFRMGSILAKQCQYDEARACYHAALAIDPGFADAQRELRELPAAIPR